MAGTDFSHLTTDELIKGIKALDLPDYIRSKAYGVDVRETLAQMTEMTIQLGVNMGLSPDDALNWARKLQESVSQSEFDSWVATLLDGGPSIFMNTLSELQTTYPNGAAGVALVRETDPAKIYVWTGSTWEDFGDYQGIELKENSVKTGNIQDNSVTASKIQNLNLGTNLHNRKTDFVDTSIDAPTGTVIPLAGINTTDFIEISGLTDISSIGYNQIAMYDTNYNYISNIYHNSENRKKPMYEQTVDGTAYLRLTYDKNYAGFPHINIGTELLPYEEFKYQFRFLETDGNYIKNRSVSNEKLSDLTTGTNLFNSKTITPKSNLSIPGGDVVPHDTYAVTDFITVERGSTVIFKNFINAIEYDEEGKYIKYSFFSGADRPNGTPLKLSEKTTDVRGIYDASLLAESELQINTGNTLLEWEPFRYLDKHGQWGVTSSRLYKKTLLNLGDSIAEAQGMLGYAGQIANKYSMTLRDYSRGGATIRKISSEPLNHTVEQQLDQAIADGIEPDFVLFNGNTNDWGNISMGEISDDFTIEVDIETYYGAFESLLRKLKTNFPDAKIIYVSAHKMSSRDLSEKHRFTKAAYEICDKYSTPYVDIFNESTMNTFFPNFVGKYTISSTDATHPNEKGYEKYYVPLIESKLESI